MASRSVCDIGGRTFRNAVRTISLTTLRRSTGMFRIIAGKSSTMAMISSANGVSHWALHMAASAAMIAAVQTHPAALR